MDELRSANQIGTKTVDYLAGCRCRCCTEESFFMCCTNGVVLSVLLLSEFRVKRLLLLHIK